MTGTLVPPWFVYNRPSAQELAVASNIWGISRGLTGFGVVRTSNQCFAHWRRTRRVTPHMVFIWLELIASTVIGGIAWGYVWQFIPPSLWFFTGMTVLWIIQVHCILQIIITRIALLIPSPPAVRRLKWSVFLVCVLINIGVACIWIPARLQRSQRYVTINNYWDRTEKIILALIDAGLNAYFIHLVRSNLIAYGLTKYVRLYRFTLGCIAVSMLMDALIISMMSLSNTFLYVCFHPLAYLVKLHIELTMAELIAKIVNASSRSASCSCACHGPRDGMFVLFQSGQQAKISPTAGRLKNTRFFRELRWKRRSQGRMVPARGKQQPPPRLEARIEEYKQPGRRVNWSPGFGRDWTWKEGGDGRDLELCQPSTSDASTIVSPGAAWMGDQASVYALCCALGIELSGQHTSRFG